MSKWDFECKNTIFSECQNKILGTRTSDGGSGNHSVSLPIILIKIKVNQMLPSSIYNLDVGLYFIILHLFSYFHKYTALSWG